MEYLHDTFTLTLLLYLAQKTLLCQDFIIHNLNYLSEMTPELVLELLNHAMIVVLKIGAPLLLTSLAVGVLISIIQALTQIQETTLSFVPKILALFVMLAVSMPFIGSTLGGFTHELFTHIVHP